MLCYMYLWCLAMLNFKDGCNLFPINLVEFGRAAPEQREAK